MEKIKRRICCQCGIYDTVYTLICHKNGSVTVKTPFIHWHNNDGCLAFHSYTIKSGKKAEFIEKFFRADELVMDDDGLFLTLDDVLYMYCTK